MRQAITVKDLQFQRRQTVRKEQRNLQRLFLRWFISNWLLLLLLLLLTRSHTTEYERWLTVVQGITCNSKGVGPRLGSLCGGTHAYITSWGTILTNVSFAHYSLPSLASDSIKITGHIIPTYLTGEFCNSNQKEILTTAQLYSSGTSMKAVYVFKLGSYIQGA